MKGQAELLDQGLDEELLAIAHAVDAPKLGIKPQGLQGAQQQKDLLLIEADQHLLIKPSGVHAGSWWFWRISTPPSTPPS